MKTSAISKKGTHYRLYEISDRMRAKCWTQKDTTCCMGAQRNSCFSNRQFQSLETGWASLFVRLEKSGIWEGFIPNIKGEKFINIIFADSIIGNCKRRSFWTFLGAKTQNRYYYLDLDYKWKDEAWMQTRKNTTHSISPGACTKFILPAGCARRRTTKKHIIPTIR